MTSLTLLWIGLAYLSVVAILFVCIAYYCDKSTTIKRVTRRLRDAKDRRYQLLQVVVVNEPSLRLPTVITNPDPYTVRDIVFNLFMRADTPAYCEYLSAREVSHADLQRLIINKE